MILFSIVVWKVTLTIFPEGPAASFCKNTEEEEEEEGEEEEGEEEEEEEGEEEGEEEREEEGEEGKGGEGEEEEGEEEEGEEEGEKEGEEEEGEGEREEEGGEGEEEGEEEEGAEEEEEKEKKKKKNKKEKKKKKNKKKKKKEKKKKRWYLHEGAMNFCQTTMCHTPEDGSLQICLCEKHRCHILYVCNECDHDCTAVLSLVRRERAATSPTALLSILPKQIITGSVPLLPQIFFF